MGGRIWATSNGKDAGCAFHFTIRCPKIDARSHSPLPHVRHQLRQISELRSLSLRTGEDRLDGNKNPSPEPNQKSTGTISRSILAPQSSAMEIALTFWKTRKGTAGSE